MSDNGINYEALSVAWRTVDKLLEDQEDMNKFKPDLENLVEEAETAYYCIFSLLQENDTLRSELNTLREKINHEQ